ncbi:MAG: TIGR03790 family protein [Lacipirellulaceae bacterium]
MAALVPLCGGLGGAAFAGGGPENVLLVVNANSPASMEVANHYARLRDLPPSNVVHLDYKGPREIASGEVFREQILQPLLKVVADRQLGLQIDVVAYSVDFPWQIDLRGDFAADVKFAPQLKPVASITGATYYYQLVLAKLPILVAPDANWFAAPAAENLSQCTSLRETPTRGFRARYPWAANGEKEAEVEKGRRYLLSTMLGVTTGRGNTTAEVIECLRRAALADGQPPTGTFYFSRNGDVRSATRHACYEGAAQGLRALGSKAVVAEGHAPLGAKDVAGMTLGIADIPLAEGGLVIQPGAICEHLTSSGGDLRVGALQTPLTDLIRAGAAGASGTVDEPYAIQAKFPLPSLQVHYRRGASLAEAFYQSITAPYQLLIVGDPLCQPWATRPKLTAAGWPTPKPGALSPSVVERLEDDLQFTPVVAATRGEGTTFWELFLDGRLRMRLPSGTQFTIRQSDLGPGRHELRLVGANPDPIESQARLLASFDVPAVPPAPAPDEPSGKADAESGAAVPDNERPPDSVRLAADRLTMPVGGRVKLTASAARATLMVVRHQSREVGRIDGGSGVLTLGAGRLGRGPVRLQAFAEPGGAPSPPVWLTVE